MDETLNIKGLTWRFRKGYEKLLSPLVSQVEMPASSQIIKASPARTVYKATLPSEDKRTFFIKEYKTPTWFDKLRFFFQESKGMREWKTGIELEKRGVPAILPLAVGEERSSGFLKRNYFISQGIENCISLREYHLPQLPPKSLFQMKVSLIHALAEFIASLHQNLVYPEDLHQGNLLVEVSPQVKFYLVDLHNVRITKLPRRKIIDNLASLNHSFDNASKTARLRFLIEYLKNDPDLQADHKDLARIIEKRTERIRWSLLKKRDKRCLKKGKYFSPISISQYKGFIRNDWLREGLNDWIAGLPDSLTQPGITIIKDSKTTSLYRVAVSCQPSAFSGQLSAVSDQQIYRGLGFGARGSGSTNPQSLIPNPSFEICVKRYNYQNFSYALKYFFRSSRAKKVWKKANALSNRGISTPSPIAYGEKRNLYLLHHSLFISAWIDDSIPLDSYLEERFGQVLTGNLLKEKWKFISDAAQYVRTVHKFQVCHGDLKAKNILVKKIDGKYLFYLLDLDGLKIKKVVSQRDRIKDLSRLNASFLNTSLLTQTNRLRFLIIYLSDGHQTDSAKRAYWKQIVEATENTLRKSKKGFM